MNKSKEEIRKYYADLRNRWLDAKNAANNPEVKKKYEIFQQQSPDLQISLYSFCFVLQDMEKLGLQGFPYLDCKTFKGWKDSGFIVKKGEKSKITGLVWKSFENGKTKEAKENKDDLTLFPKAYYLFHSTQVEPLTV